MRYSSVENENDWALNDRILLKREVSKNFKMNIQMRYDMAIQMMKLDKQKLSILYCNSINKHTCMIEKDKKNYIIFDEHHIEVLSALNFLYYTYGKSDFKRPFYELIYNQYNYFENRIKSIVSLLMSEKLLLIGDAEGALNYAKAVKEYSFSIDKNSDNGLFNLFLLYMGKQDIAQSLSMNFYVFHELAHVKYILEKEELMLVCKIIDVMSERLFPLYKAISEGKYNIIINKQECVCDIYAMLLLFKFMYAHAEKNINNNTIEFYMIECYMISITNIVIMGSAYENIELDLDEWYINAYIRIILVVNSLGVFLAEDKINLKQFQSNMNFVCEQYKNYKDVFDNIWNEIYYKYKTSRKLKYMSEDWYKAMEDTLDILSAYK